MKKFLVFLSASLFLVLPVEGSAGVKPNLSPDLSKTIPHLVVVSPQVSEEDLKKPSGGLAEGAGEVLTSTDEVVVPSKSFLFWPTGKPVVVPRLFDPPAQKWLPGHRGIDLRVRIGDLVYAATAATVLYAGDLAGRQVISLRDDTGRRYTYEPVSPTVEVGDKVLRGQCIGIAQGGHYPGDNRLHFGVKDGAENYVDPLLLLGGRIRLWGTS